MPVKQTFKFFVSKAKPVLKNTGKEITYSTIGVIAGGSIIHTGHKIKKNKMQNKRKKCLKKNPVQLTDSHKVKMKKLRAYGKCMNK